MMLRTQSVLPRFLAKWVSQVAASLGATLAATAIYATLPKSAPIEAPRLELTSGGKFAARAVMPAVDDGLDTMPLPRVIPVVAAVTLEPDVRSEASAGVASVRRAVWDGPATLELAPDRAGRVAKTVRPSPRVDIRRAVPAEHRPPIVAETGTVIASAAEPEHRDSLIQSLPKVLPHILPAAVSGLEQAWTVTASAGGSLMAHVVPQIP